MKNLIKKLFSYDKNKNIQKIVSLLKLKLNTSDLDFLAMYFGTDKFGKHFYTRNYKTYFEKFRNKKIKLLEIGVGGYDNPKAGGESLKMWKAYLKKAEIFAINLYDKSPLESKRIKIFKGSQVDFFGKSDE